MKKEYINLRQLCLKTWGTSHYVQYRKESRDLAGALCQTTVLKQMVTRQGPLRNYLGSFPLYILF